LTATTAATIPIHQRKNIATRATSASCRRRGIFIEVVNRNDAPLRMQHKMKWPLELLPAAVPGKNN